MPSEPYIIQSENSQLNDYISAHKDEIAQGLTEKGAVLFRAFGIKDTQSFEDAAKLLDPELKNDYLGTSPRNKISEYGF